MFFLHLESGLGQRDKTERKCDPSLAEVNNVVVIVVERSA